jgi:hypothetical protein
VANRKASLEYCVPATTEQYGARTLQNPCMLRHDMLQAMCKQELDLEVAWAKRKDPQGQHAPQTCPLDRLLVSRRETQAILAAPSVRTMAELPTKFFTPPDVVIPLRPTLPIPAGTVVELTIQGSWDGSKIDSLSSRGTFIPAMLDDPLVVGGTTILGAHSSVHLKGRVIGPGARPDTVQIGIAIDEVNIDALDCRICGKYADLPSNELVLTVPYTSNANNPGLMFNTKLRFTIGGTGSVDMSSAQTPAGGRRGGAPPISAAPPQSPTAPAPTPPAASDPQQRAEEARQRADRIQACVQQAVRDNPTGGIAQTMAIGACAQTK